VLQIMEGCKDAEFRTIFPTVPELRESLADWFEQTAYLVLGYEDGDRYPTLVFRARPGRRPQRSGRREAHTAGTGMRPRPGALRMSRRSTRDPG